MRNTEGISDILTGYASLGGKTPYFWCWYDGMFLAILNTVIQVDNKLENELNTISLLAGNSRWQVLSKLGIYLQ